MLKYVGKQNKSIQCIYGSFDIKVGEDVPMLFAIKFPQYVDKIEIKDVPEVKVELEIKDESEVKIDFTKNKNERKGN